MFLILTITPLFINISTTFYLCDPLNDVESIKVQLNKIFNTVSMKAVWQIIGSIFIMSVLQVGNNAWRQYLKSTLNFSSLMINSYSIIASILLCVGMLFYKYYLIKYSWRYIFFSMIPLSILVTILQFLLLFQINKYLLIPN